MFPVDILTNTVMPYSRKKQLSPGRLLSAREGGGARSTAVHILFDSAAHLRYLAGEQR